MDIEKYFALAKERLSSKRYHHIKEVTRLAGELAQAYNVDKEKAMLAGALHDMTKEVSINEQLQMIKENGIILDNISQKSTNIFHSITGAIYAEKNLNIDDKDVLNAIRYHTTGRANMSMLEKIVYTADTTSYERDYDGVEKLRELAFKDIDECMLCILEFTFSKIIKKRMVIAPDTLDCYNYLIEKNK